MEIIDKFLTVNPYSRPGKKLVGVKGVILHWTGSPMQAAFNTWKYFESGCPREKHYASAHYIVDLQGAIYHCVPDDEVAYHCGSSQKDPVSGRIYTDWARQKFGRFAENPDINSPNNCTLGIEMCTIDSQGNLSPETLHVATELTAKLIRENHLTIEEIGTHYKVVGWKDCPRLWYNNPSKFEDFKEAVKKV